MNRPSDIRITEAIVSFEEVPFRAPLKFGGRIMDRHRLINVQVQVESRGRRRATGFGSMPVGNVWAWPSESVEPLLAEAVMCEFAERVARVTDSLDEYGHAIDLVYHVSAEYMHLAKVLATEHQLPEPVPELAQLVAASPLDAAIHDAFGKVNGENSYNLLSKAFVHHDLSYYLDEQFAGEYLDSCTLREPKDRLPLYHLVGALDPLTPGEVTEPLDDGWPEALTDWIAADGLTHLKIKLSGDQLDWDVQRVLSVERAAQEAQERRGCSSWNYSLDFNERCANVEYLLTFLKKIQESAPAAFERIQYLEQPTHRNLHDFPENKMHAAAAIKPVVIDESLVSYESLLQARDLGYSGVALKACKGHTEALFAAAAAKKFGMYLCVQDLTCPGYSFLHSASLAARIPAVAAIEGNARQYCPAANKKWAREFAPLFQVQNGTVSAACLNGPGLGF